MENFAKMSKSINSAETGIDSSKSTETSKQNFIPLEYKIDEYFNVPNFVAVNEMHKKIVKSMPQPKLSHLLNFWIANISGFPLLVIFFQYLQYHIEVFNYVDCLSFKTYRGLVDAVIRREAVFQSINDLVGNIPLMCRYKFLIFDDNYPELIQVNSDLLDLQMFPFATGLPSCVMYLFHKQRRWLISDLKKEFPKCLDVEFYRQLNNFVNDRPDLVMLESPKHKATFPQLYLVLNDCISLKLCSFNVSLKDLNVADKLHLRMDYINSMKQFIPYRLIPEQFIPERKKAPMFFFNERIKYYSIIFVVIFVFPLILTLLVIFSDSLNFYWPLLCCPTIV